MRVFMAITAKGKEGPRRSLMLTAEQRAASKMTWPRAGAAATMTSEVMNNLTVNPTSEHELYLRLFITNAGGW
jgi:hypothetical protein